MTKKFIRKIWIIINRIKFTIMNIPFGSNMRIANYINVRIGKNVKIQIGKNFGFSSGDFYNPLSRNIKGAIEIENDAKFIIKDNVGISSSCIWIYKSLYIGSRTKIGADCIIIDSDAHSLNYIERRNYKTDRPNAKSKGIIIEEDVLIGTRCIILKGVTIGARSIIGAGSVVTQNIPSDCIAAGNPAKVIKYIDNTKYEPSSDITDMP